MAGELKDLIKRNRSYRRFYEEVGIDREILLELVDLARLSPSAGNMQPLKFFISYDPRKNSLIFPHLAWAGYLKDWSGPVDKERPSAYIIILGDTQVSRTFGCDHGIAAQSIMLGAAEKEFGGCIIGAFKEKELRGSLNISSRYEILLVLALGKPKEIVVVEDVPVSGVVKYWRDNAEAHHVPKRSLDDIILE